MASTETSHSDQATSSTKSPKQLLSNVGKTMSTSLKKTMSAASSALKGKPSSSSTSPPSSSAKPTEEEEKSARPCSRGNGIRNPGSIIRRQKRVLVTGGAGFIGSHLIDALMARGYDVLCADNLFSGQKRNLTAHYKHPHFEFLRHDVCQPLLVEVDEIYHLACPASPVFYQENPIKTVKTCFLGTMHMLGLAKRVNARILLASTSEVYGDPQQHPQREEYWGNVNNIGLRACYDEGKRVAETLMFEYRRQHGVDTAVARIFNTYGPRMLENDGRVVSNFIVQALEGKELTIYGDGEQTRSFCFIEDQVRGLMSLMEGESRESGPINIGNPSEFTIKELAQMVSAEVNARMGRKVSSVKFVHRELPSDDPKKRKPDITKATERLGWTPKVELKEGLAQTVDYFMELKGMGADEENENDAQNMQDAQ